MSLTERIAKVLREGGVRYPDGAAAVLTILFNTEMERREQRNEWQISAARCRGLHAPKQTHAECGFCFTAVLERAPLAYQEAYKAIAAKGTVAEKREAAASAGLFVLKPRLFVGEAE